MSDRRLCAFILAATSVSCDGEVESPSAPTVAASPQTQSSATAPATASACSAQVTIGFYTDSRCLAGTEVGTRRYDTRQTCFSWTAIGSNAQENSATRFQCYRDRLCYTQHPNSLSCGGSGLATDKESRTDVCTKEPAGQLYSRDPLRDRGLPAAARRFPMSRERPGTGEP